jgi:hypothetical protein
VFSCRKIRNENKKIRRLKGWAILVGEDGRLGEVGSNLEKPLVVVDWILHVLWQFS